MIRRLTRFRLEDGQFVANRVLGEWLLTALVSIAVVIWLAFGNITSRPDDVLYDSFSRMQPRAASDHIVVIGIDDRSLAALGPWPWPRDVHARLIDRLAEMGAGPTAYDVLFMEPTAEDDELARSIEASGRVYLPSIVGAPGPNGAPYHIDPPVGPLEPAAAGTGHVMLTPDRDGTVRHLPKWLVADNTAMEHLTLPLARAILGQQELPAPAGPFGPELLSSEPVLIRYPSAASGYRVLSFVDVLGGEIPAEFVRDKLVLVGATASGMGDRFATTTAEEGVLTPGVEIQAALLQTLIEGTAPQPVAMTLRVILSLVPLCIMLAGFLGLRPAANTILGLALIAITLAGSAAALALGVWWPPVSALAGVLIAWPLWSWRRLAAAYGYMQSELRHLKADANTAQLATLSAPPTLLSGDEVSRQVRMLSGALKQLRDSNRFITQSVQSLPDAAVVIDTVGNILVANGKARQLFGEELLSKGRLSALFVSLGLRDWQAVLAEGDQPREDILTGDGKALQLAAAPLTDAHDQIAGHIVRFADVTVLRASERQRERTLQLLGHDMRAPQVSILTLLDSTNRPSDLENRIRANAKQTLSLAEGYVQLSRAESQTLTLSPNDFGLILTEAADLLWPQAAAKGVELHSPDPDRDYPISADASLLRRVLINLLDNAIRHTPTGARVLCGLAIEQDQVVLTIADEGPGFDDEARERMFRPFQGGQIAGSGLGLAFVHTVIQRHGGQITLMPRDAEYAPTTGAVFLLSLPLASGD